MTPAPTAFACNIRFNGTNDGYSNEFLGLYEYQGMDTNGVVYFKHATMAFFMYLSDEGTHWFVGTVLASQSAHGGTAPASQTAPQTW